MTVSLTLNMYNILTASPPCLESIGKTKEPGKAYYTVDLKKFNICSLTHVHRTNVDMGQHRGQGGSCITEECSQCPGKALEFHIFKCHFKLILNVHVAIYIYTHTERHEVVRLYAPNC